MSLLSFQPAPRFKNLQNKIASVTIVGVVLAFVLVKSTFSANISLNNASAIEYGQGIAQATACSGGTNLTITPAEGFSNSTNSVKPIRTSVNYFCISQSTTTIY